MKIISLKFVFALAVLPLGAAAAEPSLDALWARAEAAQRAELPKASIVDGVAVLTPEYVRASEARNREIGDALLAFVEQCPPSDPRRWETIAALGRNGRMVVQSIGDVRKKGWAGVDYDEAAESAWAAKVEPLLAELREAEGAPEKLREAAYDAWVNEARKVAVRGGDVGEFRRRLDIMRKKYPESGMLPVRGWQLIRLLREQDPVAADAWLRQVAGGQGVLTNWAKGELAMASLSTTPIDLSFTALDGRPVDLAALRGKVVLLDFWATWCSSCVAELPNVKAVYERYHAQGFEVIGVSLDRKGDRQKLVDFVNERKLPWPQHYELSEKGRNVLAERYGVVAIPAMFLLDRTGKLAATNARGEKLEAEVKRLLGL
jgi:thiol-disulfide isomerase/thioredoxin